MSQKQHETALYLFKGLGVLVLLLVAGYSLRLAQGFSFSETDPFSQTHLTIIIDGQSKELPLEDVITIKETEHTKDLSLLRGFLYWTGIQHNSNANIQIDHEALETHLQQWEQDLGFDQVIEGSIVIKYENLEVVYPQNGTALNTKHIVRNLHNLAHKKDIRRTYTIYARKIVEKPNTDISSFEQTVQTISFALENTLTLSHDQFSITHTLEPSDMSLLVYAYKDPQTHRTSTMLDTELVAEFLAKYNRESKDARFITRDTYYVDIEPSQIGILVDAVQTSKNILTALRQKQTTTELVFSEPQNPTFETKDAEQLDIQHLVSSFTTYYHCCEARARNIEKFADIVDETIVYPGEKFNLNTFAGRRTAEEGFEPAGTLVKGSLIETVGGGVSQFATTFFNAVYWGGYKDISHKPHSRYFSRYPEGIEATISWPEPHLIFQNDTDGGILIRATYTNNSVTVSFFGNNDGRILVGSHKDGITHITTPAEGGDTSRVVTSEVSEREILHEPKEVYYTNEFIPPHVIIPKSEGRPNYSIDVTRTITQNNKQISKHTNTVRYLSEDKEFFVHSCEYAPPLSICKTPEDIEREKEELEAFFAELESNM